MIKIYRFLEKIQSTATKIVGLNCYVHVWVPSDSRMLCLTIVAKYKGKCYDTTQTFSLETILSMREQEGLTAIDVPHMAKNIRQSFMEDTVSD